MMNWAHMLVTNSVSPKNSARAHCRLPFSCMQLCSWSHDATHRHGDRARGAINSIVSLSSLAVLALMGGLAARAVRKVMMGAIRVTFWASGDGDDRWHRVASWGNCVKVSLRLDNLLRQIRNHTIQTHGSSTSAGRRTDPDSQQHGVEAQIMGDLGIAGISAPYVTMPVNPASRRTSNQPAALRLGSTGGDSAGK